jgi:hypothetical protein
VGTDDGNVQITQNGGKSWNNLTSNIKGLPKESWIAQIRASRYNKAEAWVVANHYRKGDFNPYLYRTKDFGKTWERIIDAAKVKGYVLTVMQDPVEPKLIFAGTENGLWISIDEGKNWSQMKNGFPSVSTMDLAIQERESALIIGTFGRAIWILDDLVSLRKTAVGITKDFSVFPTQDAVQVKGIFIAPPGNIWTGFNTTFEGENRPFGESMIPFYVKAPVLDKEKNVVTGSVFNNKNEVIQTITSTKIDSGLNYISWRLDEKIAKLPGGWDEPEAKGILALPGKYKVVLNYQGRKDSTYVNVIPDPRFEYSNEIEVAHHEILKRLDKTTAKLSIALTRVKESDDVVDKILLQLKDVKTPQGESLCKVFKHD